MSATEEWLRRNLGAGDDGPLPERLEPHRLRRHARTVARRRVVAGAGAVLLLAGVGATQVARTGGVRADGTDPARQGPVVVRVTQTPTPTPTLTPTPTVTPSTSTSSPRVSPSRSPSAPTRTAPATQPFTFVVERYRLRKQQGESSYEVYAEYRTPPDVLTMMKAPDGGTTGTHGPSSGLYVPYGGPGDYLLTASRKDTKVTKKLSVAALAAYPQGDIVSTTTKAKACGQGSAADHQFTVTLKNTNTTDATVTVRFMDLPPGQTYDDAPERTYRFKGIASTATLRMNWPCDLRGYGGGAPGGSFVGEVVLVNESGRQTSFTFANDGKPG